MFPHFRKCLLCNIWIYKIYTVKWKPLSHVQLFVIPWTILFMEFSRPEYWIGLPFPSPGDLHNPGIELRSPTLQVDSLPAALPGKPKNTGVGGLPLLQQTLPTQESNWGLPHCRQILYQLSYQGSPQSMECFTNLHVIALIEIIVILYNQLISNAIITWNNLARYVWLEW